jgi:hypothetical protein
MLVGLVSISTRHVSGFTLVGFVSIRPNAVGWWRQLSMLTKPFVSIRPYAVALQGSAADCAD